MDERRARLPVSTVSFPEFYRLALPQVYGFLLARCADPGIAEELCSDAFLAAAVQVRAGSDAVGMPWLFAVARHKLIDFYRRRDRLRRILPELPVEAVAPDVASATAVDDGVTAAMRSLPASQRSALLLRYQDDLPVAEVAVVLELSVQATESLLARGRASLRDRLERGAVRD